MSAGLRPVRRHRGRKLNEYRIVTVRRNHSRVLRYTILQGGRVVGHAAEVVITSPVFEGGDVTGMIDKYKHLLMYCAGGLQHRTKLDHRTWHDDATGQQVVGFHTVRMVPKAGDPLKKQPVMEVATLPLADVSTRVTRAHLGRLGCTVDL